MALHPQRMGLSAKIRGLRSWSGSACHSWTAPHARDCMSMPGWISLSPTRMVQLRSLQKARSSADVLSRRYRSPWELEAAGVRWHGRGGHASTRPNRRK